LDFRYLSDKRFEFFIIFGPLLHFDLKVTGNVKRDRFARLFPGDEKDRMLRPLVEAGAVVFSAFAGGGYEGPFDPGIEIWNAAD